MKATKNAAVVQTARASRFGRAAIVLSAVALLTTAPLFAALNRDDPVSTELAANTTTGGDQNAASVAMNASGGYVVAWTSIGQDGSGAGTYVRRYSASGIALTPEIRANTTTAGDQTAAGVAMDAAGDFVVTWTSVDQDGDRGGVYARVFNPAGVPQTGEFRVNTTTANDQVAAGAAMDAAGDFVITWTGNSLLSAEDVYARRYNLSGTPVTGEIAVNSTRLRAQFAGGVAMDAGGNFSVVWRSRDALGLAFGVFARRFSAAGAALTPEIHVNSAVFFEQRPQAIASDAAGNFVVAWTAEGQLDGNQLTVVARRVSATGVLLTNEVIVNTTTQGDQVAKGITSDATGDFAVTWNGPGDGSGQAAYVRRFRPDGAAGGAEVRVNTVTAGNQIPAGVAMDADGDYVVAWTSAGQDGSGNGVYTRRFAGPEDVDLALSGASHPALIQNPGITTGGAPFNLDFIVSNTHAPVAPTGVAAIDQVIGSATGVHLDVTLPTGISYSGSSTGTNWTCNVPGGPGVLSCDYTGTLLAGTATALSVGAQTTTTLGTFTSSATADANQYDSVQANNTVNVGTTVVCDPGTLDFRHISNDGYSVSEGVGSVTVSVRRLGGSCGAVSADYATSPRAVAPATPGEDYISTSGTLNWANGDGTDKTFQVTILDDALNEHNEVIQLDLSNATGGATLGSLATIGIIDDDPFAIVNLLPGTSVVEGGSVTVTAVLDGPSGQEIRVPFGFIGGSAGLYRDYTLPENRTIIIPPGATSGSLTIDTIDDSIHESSETFIVQMTSLSGRAVPGPNTTATYTILDND